VARKEFKNRKKKEENRNEMRRPKESGESNWIDPNDHYGWQVATATDAHTLFLNWISWKRKSWLTLNEAKSNNMQQPVVATALNVSSSSAWNFLSTPLLGIINTQSR